MRYFARMFLRTGSTRPHLGSIGAGSQLHSHQPVDLQPSEFIDAMDDTNDCVNVLNFAHPFR